MTWRKVSGYVDVPPEDTTVDSVTDNGYAEIQNMPVGDLEDVNIELDDRDPNDL